MKDGETGLTLPHDVTAVSSRVAGVLHVLNVVVAHEEGAVLHSAVGDARGVHAGDAVHIEAKEHRRILDVVDQHPLQT